jgi:hypothetical protein
MGGGSASILLQIGKAASWLDSGGETGLDLSVNMLGGPVFEVKEIK